MHRKTGVEEHSCLVAGDTLAVFPGPVCVMDRLAASSCLALLVGSFGALLGMLLFGIAAAFLYALGYVSDLPALSLVPAVVATSWVAILSHGLAGGAVLASHGLRFVERVRQPALFALTIGCYVIVAVALYVGALLLAAGVLPGPGP